MNDSPDRTLKPSGRRFVLARTFRLLVVLVAATAAIVLIGFSSSILARAASERATRSGIEAFYLRVLPTAPPLRWIDPQPIRAYGWPQHVYFDLPRSRLPLRYWLFAPHCYYAPENRRLVTVSEGQDYVAVAYLVTHIPMPFVVRVHYGWIFKMRERHDYTRFGLSSGGMDVGVVTYLAVFGHPVRIDEHPYFGWV